MKVTFFGTTTLLFDDGEDQILFDCHFTRPSFVEVGLKTLRTNTKIIDDILCKHEVNRLKAIFVSHSHHDHVMDVPYVAKKCDCDVFGTISTLNVARGLSIDENKLHEFVCHQPIQVGKYAITIIPSLHSKAKWYNNDLGQTIDSPLMQPAKKKDYKEGGSFDFLVEVQDKKYLIRPSCNYIKGQNDDIHADVLYLGVGGLSKLSDVETKEFFEETIEKVHPDIVIPLHWDNFFSSLDQPTIGMPHAFENTEESLYRVVTYCEKHKISYVLQLPRTFINV